MTADRSQMISLRLKASTITKLDEMVASGRFDSRADVIKRGLAMVLKQERDRELVKEFIEAYRKQPLTEDERKWAVAGSELMAEFFRAEDEAAAAVDDAPAEPEAERPAS